MKDVSIVSELKMGGSAQTTAVSQPVEMAWLQVKNNAMTQTQSMEMGAHQNVFLKMDGSVRSSTASLAVERYVETLLSLTMSSVMTTTY